MTTSNRFNTWVINMSLLWWWTELPKVWTIWFVRCLLGTGQCVLSRPVLHYCSWLMVGEILAVLSANFEHRTWCMSDHVLNPFKSVLTQNSCPHFSFGMQQQQLVGMQWTFCWLGWLVRPIQDQPIVGHQRCQISNNCFHPNKNQREKMMDDPTINKNGVWWFFKVQKLNIPKSWRGVQPFVAGHHEVKRNCL
jgi:hypothetical protein